MAPNTEVRKTQDPTGCLSEITLWQQIRQPSNNCAVFYKGSFLNPKETTKDMVSISPWHLDPLKTEWGEGTKTEFPGQEALRGQKWTVDGSLSLCQKKPQKQYILHGAEGGKKCRRQSPFSSQGLVPLPRAGLLLQYAL